MRAFILGKNGAGEEARTLDFHLGRVALYQLSYARVKQLFKWWRGVDSNHRKLTLADLQSAPFGHSGTTPFKWSCSQESNLRPTDYKSVALPTELEQLLHQRKIVSLKFIMLTPYEIKLFQVRYQNIFPWQSPRPMPHSVILFLPEREDSYFSALNGPLRD